MTELNGQIVSALNLVIETQKASLELQADLLRQSLHMTNQLLNIPTAETETPGPVESDGVDKQLMLGILGGLPKADSDVLGGS